MSFGSSYFTLLRATMIGLSAQAPLAEATRSNADGAIGSAESPARTERRGERWRTAEETSGPPREEEEEKKEEGTAEWWRARGGKQKMNKKGPARHCSRPLARDS
ncbi:Uncharacterized protein DBV15_00890 [Temnothorax longispinosus]|uniref:Secreted protein n=1 Tax=Temnothorax longispinosus TaxID=300112 RepID=A0A4S2JBG3_9HYME|nr:Uncharacterized protein DBV15_00890 [Temnothorax longispinosus]